MSTFYVDNLLNSQITQQESVDPLLLPQKNKKSSTYSDIALDLSFNQEGSIENIIKYKDINGSYDTDAIKNSIYNLLWYRPGFYLLKPELGLNLEQFLFQPINDFLANVIKTKIEEHLNKYENRIKLIKTEVNQSEDNETINIKIFYDVRATGVSDTIFLYFNSTFYQI